MAKTTKASPKSLPQYATIEQPFGCEPPEVHCPICGVSTREADKKSACKHLAFIYCGEVGEFAYQSRAFSEKTEDLEQDDVTLKKFPKMLSKVGYDNKLLAIEVTYGGMMCGPAWYTDVYGFDYGALASEEEGGGVSKSKKR